MTVGSSRNEQMMIMRPSDVMNLSRWRFVRQNLYARASQESVHLHGLSQWLAVIERRAPLEPQTPQDSGATSHDSAAATHHSTFR